MRYARTPAKVAVFQTNVEKLGNMMVQHYAMQPYRYPEKDDGALYIGSQVTAAPPVKKKLPEPIEKGKRFKEHEVYWRRVREAQHETEQRSKRS
jgi:hypothetical protein